MDISERIKCICDLAGTGEVICDVGCDHGYTTITLLKSKAFKRAIAMDINEGPLAKASLNVKQAKVSDKVELRLSDGLKMVKPGEADVAVITGMGGPLVQKILLASMDVVKQMTSLVIGAQSELYEFRQFLFENNFCINKEKILFEDGKYYFLMNVSYNADKELYKQQNDPIFLSYSHNLLIEKDTVLLEYLKWEKQMNDDLIDKLKGQTKEGAVNRLKELMNKKDLNDKAFSYFK